MKRSDKIDAHIQSLKQLLTKEEQESYSMTFDFLNEMWEEISDQEDRQDF